MSISIFSNTLLNLVGFVPVDTKTRESHLATATTSNFALEDGSTVTDHVILNPLVLEVEFFLSSLDLPAFNVGSSYGLRSALLYNLLSFQLETRKLYTVLTRHKLYRNMCLIELAADHEGPFTGSLIGRAKFQQVIFAKLSGVEAPQETLSSDVSQQASTPTNYGTIPARDVGSGNSFYDQFIESLGLT